MEAVSSSAPRTVTHGNDLASEQIAAGFRARQASSAYQEMLVRALRVLSWLFLSNCSFFLKGHRNLLPIAQYRDEIIQTLENSQVLVLSGETGWYDYAAHVMPFIRVLIYFIQRQVNPGACLHS